MTRRSAIVAFLFLAVAFAFSVSSRADSDGHFCASRGYVAYELRNGITPGVAGHVLRVVRFGAKRGSYIAGEVTLQDFQVHSMTCNENQVEISGWGDIFRKCVIDITRGNIHVVDHAEDPTRKFDASKDGPEPSQFADAQSEPLPLESGDPEHKYALLLSGSEKAVKGGLEHHRKAELIQTDRQGAITQRLVLYKGQSLETID